MYTRIHMRTLINSINMLPTSIVGLRMDFEGMSAHGSGPNRATVVLLGTCHTSSSSCAQARKAVRELRPDCLMLERCSEGLEALLLPTEATMDFTRKRRQKN